jgi:hypothetical protein
MLFEPLVGMASGGAQPGQLELDPLDVCAVAIDMWLLGCGGLLERAALVALSPTERRRLSRELGGPLRLLSAATFVLGMLPLEAKRLSSRDLIKRVSRRQALGGDLRKLFVLECADPTAGLAQRFIERLRALRAESRAKASIEASGWRHLHSSAPTFSLDVLDRCHSPVVRTARRLVGRPLAKRHVIAVDTVVEPVADNRSHRPLPAAANPLVGGRITEHPPSPLRRISEVPLDELRSQPVALHFRRP